MVYQVAVRTPFGRFNTDISIDISIDGDLTGDFTIMGLSSSFSGKGDADGKVEFIGNIDTPIGEIEYSVIGQIDGADFLGTADTRIGKFEFSPLVRRRKKK